MKEQDDLLEYLIALFRADAKLTGDPDKPVFYNGYDTESEMRIDLLDLELEVCPALAKMSAYGERDALQWKLIRERVLELEDVFSPRKDGVLHRYLHVERSGEPVEFRTLDEETRYRINRFVLIQKESYQRYARSFFAEPAVLPSPFTLLLNEMEIGELLAFFYRSDILECLTGDMTEKEFIRFFCRVWNLPSDRDYYTLISKALARPHPTALIDRLKKLLEDHIEELDARRW